MMPYELVAPEIEPQISSPTTRILSGYEVSLPYPHFLLYISFAAISSLADPGRNCDEEDWEIKGRGEARAAQDKG